MFIPDVLTMNPSAGSDATLIIDVGGQLADTDVTLPCQTPDLMDLWFAEQATQLNEAKRLCGTCPLRAECLEGAVRRAEPWGVWGGHVFVDGQIVANKRGRGRPRRNSQEAA